MENRMIDVEKKFSDLKWNGCDSEMMLVSMIVGGGYMPLNDLQLSVLMKESHKSCFIFLCDHQTAWQWNHKDIASPIVARDSMSDNSE
jgi:hypothetical protein